MGALGGDEVACDEWNRWVFGAICEHPGARRADLVRLAEVVTLQGFGRTDYEEVGKSLQHLRRAGRIYYDGGWWVRGKRGGSLKGR